MVQPVFCIVDTGSCLYGTQEKIAQNAENVEEEMLEMAIVMSCPKKQNKIDF